MSADFPGPDVLVIMLDAVRSRDVYVDRDGTVDPALPFLSRFARDAAVFPRAASAAPWTLPSVASLMTGLYPWDHRLSAFAGSYLDPRVPTLASTLRARGYATVLLSANNVVGPRTNLSDGFDHRYVGDWWEMYLRLRRTQPSALGTTVASESADGTRRPRLVSRADLMRRGMRLVFRMPGVAERASFAAQRIRTPGVPAGVTVSPWIEPTFRGLLESIPRSQPMLTVMHLNDAHEPYYRDPSPGAPLRDGRLAMVRQDFMHQIEGAWRPNDRELARLHALYRDMIRVLDGRLATLLGDLARLRDLDRTLVVISADHGQAFGEGGWLFHMNSPDEALLRVPMIVRFPGRAHVGRGRGWASTVDILPSAFEAAGVPVPAAAQGQSFQSLFAAERVTPVWSLSDGLPVRHLDGIVAPPTLRSEVAQRKWLVAYQGARKWVYDLNTKAFDERTVDVPSDVVDSGVPRAGEAVQAEAIRLAERMLAPSAHPDSDEVSQRLESWGYGV
jgi:arylsulfatase A-like enzyme